MKTDKIFVFENEGRAVWEYRIVNDNGIEMRIINLGAILRGIFVPDRIGNVENVVVSWKDTEDYINDGSCTGAVVGRTAGRVADAYFHINGIKYELPKNQGENNLHGGPGGFNARVWNGEIFENENEAGVILKIHSFDGDNGYPGNLDIKVRYTLNNENEIKIDYDGISDKDTVVNMTNHSYFNLSGNLKRDILHEKLIVNANQIAEIREDSAPTGNLLKVENTPFDFRLEKEIGKDIGADNIQLARGSGYDHPWLLNGVKGYAAKLSDSISGRSMEVYTDKEALVIYTTNHPDREKELLCGGSLKKNYAVCFEAQNLPIGENEAFLKESILKKGIKYHSETVFKFIF